MNVESINKVKQCLLLILLLCKSILLKKIAGWYKRLFKNCKGKEWVDEKQMIFTTFAF